MFTSVNNSQQQEQLHRPLYIQNDNTNNSNDHRGYHFVNDDIISTTTTVNQQEKATQHGRVFGTDTAKVPVHFSMPKEMYALCILATPYIIIQWNLFFIFPYTASVVGRRGTSIDLAAFSLGSLLGNLTCLSIMEGTLSAADTLLPRMYTKHMYDEMVYIILRCAVVSTIFLVLPILPIYFYSSYLLIHVFHQDSMASELATIWIRIYFLGIIPNLFYRLCMRFGMAQKYTLPFVISCWVPCTILHPILVHYFVTVEIGYIRGSAYALVTTQWLTSFCLLLYLYIRPIQYQPLNSASIVTWYMKDFLSISNLCHVLFNDRQSMVKFIWLALGGIFSMMEWWFFEILCFIAGTFGVIPLCIHTIAYNIVPIVFMIPLGILGGLTIRMGHIIVDQLRHAQLLATYCMLFTVCWGILITICINLYRSTIIQSFTNDPLVVAGALQIWTYLCYYILLLHIFAISQAILRSLGKQWYLASIIIFCLYGITLPTVVYFSIVRHGQLLALWIVLPICYTFLQTALISVYTTMDWSKAIEPVPSWDDDVFPHADASLVQEDQISSEVMISQSFTEESPLISKAIQ
jgi:multidrug resistance protein, MATE family